SWLLRPPVATLFPYTTLFRSDGAGGGARRTGVLPPQARLRPARAGAMAPRAARPGGGPRGGPRLLPARRRGTRPSRLHTGGMSPDRKSTRLNSSHVAISYAVF